MHPFDDETVRQLRATIDAHMAGGTDARALQALEALSAIRTDCALLHIHAIATRAKGKLGKRAAQILGDVSRQRGLSSDELEDRIVPELGLDERGTMTLDYGARQFKVGFDEHLQPFVRDKDGLRLNAIPRPGKDDDPEQATRASETWKRLRDDVKTIGAEQARRLEGAMCLERHWTADALANHLVTHRLLGHFARRLVFAVTFNDQVQSTFRVADDGTYSDSSEHTVTIGEHARLVIAHPAILEEDALARWRQIFLDYQIVQPFQQLEREVVVPTAEELHTTSTQRFVGKRVPTSRFFSLKHKGWDLGYDMSKRLNVKARASLQMTPPFVWYPGHDEEEHTLGALTIRGVTFAALPPVVRSEVLRDVELLTR